MGTLGFVCPTTGREVDTGIEVDSLSFTSLHSEQLGCPECLETHQLSLIKVWVADTGPARADRVISIASAGSYFNAPGTGVHEVGCHGKIRSGRLGSVARPITHVCTSSDQDTVA